MTRREMARLRHKRNRRIMAVCVVVALAVPIITLLACSTQEPKEVLPTVHKAATAAPLAHTSTLTAAPSVTPYTNPRHDPRAARNAAKPVDGGRNSRYRPDAFRRVLQRQAEGQTARCGGDSQPREQWGLWQNHY